LTAEVLKDDEATICQDISCRYARINLIVTTGNECDSHTDWDAEQRDDKAEGDFKQQFVLST
jgi:hypothetical protein